jgi:hypothetical protein
LAFFLESKGAPGHGARRSRPDPEPLVPDPVLRLPDAGELDREEEGRETESLPRDGDAPRVPLPVVVAPLRLEDPRFESTPRLEEPRLESMRRLSAPRLGLVGSLRELPRSTLPADPDGPSGWRERDRSCTPPRLTSGRPRLEVSVESLR